MSECENDNQLELELEWPSGRAPDYYEKLRGKAVRCTVPVEFWSDDWHDGMRQRVYIGTICGHYAGGWCLQPPDRQQGISEERGQCFPVTNQMRFEVLPGRPEDY
jgi:hypothetical protein